MALGHDLYLEVTVDGVTYVLSGTENGLTGFTQNRAHALRRRPGGGSQAEQDRDNVEEGTTSYTIDVNDNTREFLITHMGKPGAYVAGPERKLGGKERRRWTGKTYADIVPAADNFVTATTVTVYHTSKVESDTF